MWQDWYFATSGIIYGATLIPSVLSPATRVSRVTSGLTLLTLGLGALVYVSLGLNVAALSTMPCLGAWALLWKLRPLHAPPADSPEVPEPAATSARPFVVTDPAERAVILHYRQWIEAQAILNSFGSETEA